jgi:type VI secretion system secreted protein VgrG
MSTPDLQGLSELVPLVTEFLSGRQTDRLMRLHTPLDSHYGPDTLIPETLQGSEVIGTQRDAAAPTHPPVTGYRLTLTALSYQSDIPLTPALGQPVLLELLTAQSRTELRPFHGHITRFERLASDGGLTRYRLTIEPWLSLLRHRRDSTVYQDMSVIDILDAVLRDGRGEGDYTPAWQFNLADPSIYPKRSLTTQYNETDLDFIHRLMNAEGLYYWFTHSADPGSPQLGSHTMIIADHNAAFTANPQPIVRYTQSGTVLPEDSIDSWHECYRTAPTRVETVTWDYRANKVHHSRYDDPSPSAAFVRERLGFDRTYYDTPGQYAYHDSSQGERYAKIAMDAIHTRRHDVTAAGTVRTAAPGSFITLEDNPSYANLDTSDGEATTTFIITRVSHQARNNLIAHQRTDTADHSGNHSGEQSRYRNTLTLIPDTTTYRPQTDDGHGIRLHPKPTVNGQQTAIVVGNSDPIHTDRDHRIKIQYHWQRGEQSHSRLDHPYPDDHVAAPGDSKSGTWVRVMSSLAPTAGDNWGSVQLPRVGQEVLVDFLGGDIDRPVVIASLYNGRGQDNAAHNQIAGTAPTATANATPWFAGSEDAYNHAAVLSGIKTQSLANSQDGTGGYNQLVFDDSANQSRISLQQHEAQHTGDSELNLGQLTHQSDNQRLNPLGYGLELKTRHSAAVRAGSGLLISSDRQAVNGMQMDSKPAQAAISRQHDLNAALAQAADSHQAKGANDPAAEQLTAIKQLDHSRQVISQQTSQGQNQDISTYSEPQLQLSSPAGIVAATAANAVVTAGNTSNLTAEQDLSVSSQAQQHHAVKDGIRLFTQGIATDSNKPNQETGIRIHAAQGKLSSQSQSGNTHINASKDVHIASTEQTVTLAAPQHLLLTSGGAYIKLEGGNIEVHGPGVMAFKGSLTELAGPGSGSARLPAMPVAGILNMTQAFSQQVDLSDFIGMHPESGQAVDALPYEFRDTNGRILQQGHTNESGDTQRVITEKQEQIVLYVGAGDWKLAMDGKHDL